MTRPGSYLERSVVVLMLGRQLIRMLLSQGNQSAFGDTDHTIETVCIPHSYVPCATLMLPCIYSVLHVLLTVLHMYVWNDTHANIQHQVFRPWIESDIDITAFPSRWMKYMFTFYIYEKILLAECMADLMYDVIYRTWMVKFPCFNICMTSGYPTWRHHVCH